MYTQSKRNQGNQSQDGFVSRAIHPLSRPKGRVIYDGKRWVLIPVQSREKASVKIKRVNPASYPNDSINGFTTFFAVLHLDTLTIKDESLHGSDHLTIMCSHLRIKGSWAFTANCSGISVLAAARMAVIEQQKCCPV